MAWNFHVAPYGQVRNEPGHEERLVFDPMLFERPVTCLVWRQRMHERGDDIRFEVTDRFVSNDPFDVNGRQLRTLNFRERNKHLRTSFDLENCLTFAALSQTLRGKFVDQLKVSSPQSFQDFMQRFRDPWFRQWWQTPIGYDAMDALLLERRFFNIPMSDIECALQSVSPECREFAIKTKFWSPSRAIPRDCHHNAKSALSN